MVLPVSRLDLLSIRLFVAVVEERSIVKAASRENITTSAVSKRISDLEANLRTDLLLRHRQGVEVTPAGHALLLHCRAILARIDQIFADMSEFGEGMRGLIRLAANESAAIGYLPGDIARFLALAPFVKVDMQVATSPTVIRMVLDNASDIGVFTGQEPTGDLRVLHYRSDRLVAVCPASLTLECEDGAVAFERILDHANIGSEASGAIEVLMQRAAGRLGRKLDTRVRVSSFDAAARLVEAGVGISIMTEAVARPLARALDIGVVRLAEPWARRELRICLRKGAEQSPLLQRFLAVLQDAPPPLDGAPVADG